MKTASIRWEIGERVRIPELERPAIVLSVWINKAGTQYEVAWFDNGDRKTAYMLEAELADAVRCDERTDK
jgi:hypothetical protein